MSIAPNQNGSYAVKKGDMVFCEGQVVQSLNLLLQGKIDVFIAPIQDKSIKDTEIPEGVFKRGFRIFDIDKNIFIGASDIFMSGNHTLSYRASQDCSIYAYITQNPNQIWSLVNSQKDYGAYIVNSLCALIGNSCTALARLNDIRNQMKIMCENLIVYFWSLKEKYDFDFSPASGFFRQGLDRLCSMKDAGLSVPGEFSRQFMEKDHADKDGEDSFDTSFNKAKTDYYIHLYNLPVELRKSFFSTDLLITSYHCRDASYCFDEILSLLKDSFDKTEEFFKQLYSEDGECIYSAYVKAAGEIAVIGLDISPVLSVLDYIIGKVKETIAIYQNEYLHKCETDLEYIEHSLNNVKASLQTGLGNRISSAGKESGINAGFENIPEELKDSAKKIIEYAGIPEANANSFLMNLTAFRNLRDKLSTDDSARNIRSGVTSGFFEVYESVFKKVYEQKDSSRLLNMFLTYGYMDEKLLTVEQTLALYRLAGKDTADGQVPVYNMKEWLTKIYEIQKDPSINEFGQDYYDIFREMKKHGQITDKDKLQYDNNRNGRLSFEVQNMLRINQKLCHGQISVYVPVLYRDMVTKDPAKAIITPEMINEGINRILEVDFSAFYREIHFRDQVKGIEKELIMKSVVPDFILIPIYGTRTVMWQEITGRNRSTPGRFLIPIFTDENIDDMLVRLMGNFRWELCRTMMGSAWNDVSQSSLTSEYTDYIQFYKKNKDLSEEAKEKTKVQLQKYHNKSRDIFTSDYEIWLNNEAKGNVRLNKVVRNILYRHCPFSKQIRLQLEKQPLYAEMAVLSKNLRAKQARELDNRYNKYKKSNGSLDPDLEQNLIFFRDM